MSQYQVSIDIGGTFTDCVVSDGARLAVVKAPSTPPAFERGFMDALGLAARAFDSDLADFLAGTQRIVHGTTVATNALVEGRTSAVGLICTAGHPDVLTLREAPRKRAFDWRLDYPKPFVPRNRTCEVRGRIDARGNEIAALSEDDVQAAVDHFKRCPVDAIAVSLLWSVVEPAHEERVGAIVGELWPEVPVTLSHALNPIPREYRRTIATAIDASLHGIVPAYLGRLEDAVREAGFSGTLLVANCQGGMMTVGEIAARPIHAVMSGPTLAPIAALSISDEPDIVVIDMGGTTFDVSAIRARSLIRTTEAPIVDDLLGLPKIDVRSVGAGGGSIAWVDSGGLLRVGPVSAGADPGPAAYGRGGTRPTVTDANLVLGLLDPGYFLGGRLALDAEAAHRAVGTVADALGLDVAEAAYAIHVTSNENMIAAIEDITVNEGIDPAREFPGGGRGCHRLPHRRDGPCSRHRPFHGAGRRRGPERLRRIGHGHQRRRDGDAPHQQPPLRPRRRQPHTRHALGAGTTLPRARRRAGGGPPLRIRLSGPLQVPVLGNRGAFRAGGRRARRRRRAGAFDRLPRHA